MLLWLDDERPAPEGWVWVKNAKELFGVLNIKSNREVIRGMSLDHDLGLGQTGSQITSILADHMREGVEHRWEFPLMGVVTIHSWNINGGKEMFSDLVPYFDVHIWPYSDNLFKSQEEYALL